MKCSVTRTPLKGFLLRGCIFGGLGPVVLGIVYLILHHTLEDLALTGSEVFLGILSTYILAFIHAGSGVFHQIESWSPCKSYLCQISLLYVAYVLCYVLNDWLPFEPLALALFTAAFAVGYGVICLVVHLSIHAAVQRLNRRLE